MSYQHEGRHKEFQFGSNPMEMTEFEKKKVVLEKQQRENAHRQYVYGIQGRDGGKCIEPPAVELS